MKKIAKITRVAIKRAYNQLKDKQPLFCKSLNSDVKITRLYLNHINWSAKKRNLKEVVLRLLTVILVEEILEKWELVETRKTEEYEYYWIKHETDWEIFRMVLSKRIWSKNIYLLSTFVQD